MILYRSAIALAAAITLFVVGSACKSPQAEWESKIRKECGKDLVFDISRFGYFGDDNCWKVTCFELSEKVYHEKIVCLKEGR